MSLHAWNTQRERTLAFAMMASSRRCMLRLLLQCDSLDSVDNTSSLDESECESSASQDDEFLHVNEFNRASNAYFFKSSLPWKIILSNGGDGFSWKT